MKIAPNSRTTLLSFPCLGVLLLLLTSIASASAQAAGDGKANATQLAESAGRAVGWLVKAARSSKDRKLSPSASSGKPFWASVRRLNQAVDKLGRGLYLKDQTFFHGLGDAVSAVTATSVALAQSGARDPKVTDALGQVDRALSLLEQNYGKASARKSKGGGLSPEEKRKLRAMRNKQKELQQKLKDVEKKVSRNREAIRGIERIRRESDRIYHARDTVADFLAALLAIRVVDGLLWGWHWWWGPWGGWVEHYSFVYVDVYYDAIDVIDYDWAVTEAEVALGDYELEVAIDDADVAEADAYLDATTDDIEAVGGEGLTDDAVPADPELRSEDITDVPDSSPGDLESGVPDVDLPTDYSERPDAIAPVSADYDAGAGFDSEAPMDTDVGGFDMPTDGGGADFDAGMDMGGADIDF